MDTDNPGKLGKEVQSCLNSHHIGAEIILTLLFRFIESQWILTKSGNLYEFRHLNFNRQNYQYILDHRLILSNSTNRRRFFSNESVLRTTPCSAVILCSSGFEGRDITHLVHGSHTCMKRLVPLRRKVHFHPKTKIPFSRRRTSTLTHRTEKLFQSKTKSSFF